MRRIHRMTAAAATITICLAASSAPAQTPVTNAFTYQFRLVLGGDPVNGLAEFEFSLWNAESGGVQIGPSIFVEDDVIDGRYTTRLDFGPGTFNGDARWLEVTVASPPGSGFVTLTPRQPLTATPYAARAIGNWALGGNGGTNSNNHFIGTTDNQALELRINNQRALRLIPASSSVSGDTLSGNFIAGGLGNSIQDGAGNVIVGGGGVTWPNTLYGSACVIGGGLGNQVGSNSFAPDYATISGGILNQATANGAAIAGGAANVAGDSAAIGGGSQNDATGDFSAIGGGTQNSAIGRFATVPGGANNAADGDFSMAAGFQAEALHHGSFVWSGKSAPGDVFASTSVEQFLIDAPGGVGIGTNAPQTELDVNGTVTAAAFVGPGGELNFDGSGIQFGARPLVGDQVYAFPTADVVLSPGIDNWQSFTAGVTGDLGQIAILRDVNAGAGTMTVYVGEGIGGTVLATLNVPVSQSLGTQLIDVFPSVSLAAGQVYTIRLQGPGWFYQAAGGYPGGRAFGPPEPNPDFYFSTLMLQAPEETVIVRAGSVGIGREPIGLALEVEGNASKSIAGGWIANSDRRIKTEIETISGALDTLDRVRLVSFKYTDDYQATHAGVGDGRYLNVIAQEFAEVFPDHVKGSGERLPDGSEILHVDTYPLTIYSAAAIQELHEQVQRKDAEIAELKQRLERIERLVNHTLKN